MDSSSLAAMNLLSPDTESLPISLAPTPVSSSPSPAPADSRSELKGCNNNNYNNKPEKESFWSLILQVTLTLANTSQDTRAGLQLQLTLNEKHSAMSGMQTGGLVRSH